MSITLTHVAVQVRDLTATIAFYEEYCGLRCIHRRHNSEGGGVVWMAEPGREHAFIFVFMSGGQGAAQDEQDYGHLGFAVESRESVDRIAEKARGEELLVWPPREEPYPVGYYCAVRDPDGIFVEFSYGQPLGPGAPSLDEERIGEPIDP